MDVRRLGLLRFGFQLAPLFIETQHLIGTRRQAARGKPSVELFRIVSDGAEIVHLCIRKSQHTTYRD